MCLPLRPSFAFRPLAHSPSHRTQPPTHRQRPPTHRQCAAIREAESKCATWPYSAHHGAAPYRPPAVCRWRRRDATARLAAGADAQRQAISPRCAALSVRTRGHAVTPRHAQTAQGTVSTGITVAPLSSLAGRDEVLVGQRRRCRELVKELESLPIDAADDRLRVMTQLFKRIDPVSV